MAIYGKIQTYKKQIDEKLNLCEEVFFSTWVYMHRNFTSRYVYAYLKPVLKIAGLSEAIEKYTIN